MGWSKDPLIFSKHARLRMASRGIALPDGAMARLGVALAHLDGKGGRSALVLLDRTVMLVSVKNLIVITIIDLDEARGSLFTQIDSVVIA